MKTFLHLLLALVISFSCVAQDKEIITQKILLYPDTFNSTQNLLYKIKTDFKTDRERVYAVYSWITNNIAYDYAAGKKYTQFWNPNLNTDPYAHYNKEVANYTFQSKIAICHGYSLLFKDLCDALGIETTRVVGYAKTAIAEIGGPWNSNHAWNIVVIDNKKYLIDPTWGAGTWNNGFVKNPSDFYFMTPPELFIEKHYPENPKDALLDKVPSKAWFLNKAIPYTWNNTLVKAQLPKSGVIKKPKAESQTIKFDLIVKQPITRLSIWDNGKFVQVTDFLHTNNQLTFNYSISRSYSKNKLLVYINNKAVLKYRVVD